MDPMTHPTTQPDQSLELHPMTKVEVVVGGSDVDLLRTIFDQVGVTGFTMLGNVAGFGHHGFHEGRLAFNDRDGLVMLITVVPVDRARALVDRLRTLLANRPGVMFVSDVGVSRPQYFTGDGA
jgi:nitrogen regulatory protein PII